MLNEEPITTFTLKDAQIVQDALNPLPRSVVRHTPFWQEVFDKLVAGDTIGVTAESLVVGDPFFYRGQVPLIISEWGGFGWSGYGGPGEQEDKASRIKAFKQAVAAPSRATCTRRQ